jgi:hypothetical protein
MQDSGPWSTVLFLLTAVANNSALANTNVPEPSIFLFFRFFSPIQHFDLRLGTVLHSRRTLGLPRTLPSQRSLLHDLTTHLSQRMLLRDLKTLPQRHMHMHGKHRAQDQLLAYFILRMLAFLTAFTPLARANWLIDYKVYSIRPWYFGCLYRNFVFFSEFHWVRKKLDLIPLALTKTLVLNGIVHSLHETIIDLPTGESPP